jgi:hypothetical protein
MYQTSKCKLSSGKQVNQHLALHKDFAKQFLDDGLIHRRAAFVPMSLACSSCNINLGCVDRSRKKRTPNELLHVLTELNVFARAILS